MLVFTAILKKPVREFMRDTGIRKKVSANIVGDPVPPIN